MGVMIMIGKSTFAEEARIIIRFSDTMTQTGNAIAEFASNIDLFVDEFKQLNRRHKGWWFVPKSGKRANFKAFPPNSIITTDRKTGSGWKKNKVHFIFKGC